MKLLNLLIIASTALFCNAALAEKFNSVSCPSVAALQKEKLLNIFEFQPGLYMAISENYYETSIQWRFSMGPLPAKSQKDALRFANARLKNLAGPLPSSSVNNNRVCSYITGDPSNSAIATPTADE